VIKVESIHKWFGKNHVLQGTNLEIYDRETISIIGGSGCGKTILLKHIIGLLRPDKGKIYIDNLDLGSLSEEGVNEQQEKFGYLFQDGALFDSLTAGENVAFGLRYAKLNKRTIQKKVSVCLAQVGLAGIEKIKPAELSGGMRKRVALARAIAYDPKYVLYDEPTTGLDPIVTDTVSDLILHLQKTLDITSVVVTHDMPVAYKVSNRIAMIYEGKVVAMGTPDEIKKTDNPYVRQFIAGSSKGPIKPKIREY
jgi:phospholipid/cholesterol/gamma-HCH transport system ATP-binding protein